MESGLVSHYMTLKKGGVKLGHVLDYGKKWDVYDFVLFTFT